MNEEKKGAKSTLLAKIGKTNPVKSRKKKKGKAQAKIEQIPSAFSLAESKLNEGGDRSVTDAKKRDSPASDEEV